MKPTPLACACPLLLWLAFVLPAADLVAAGLRPQGPPPSGLLLGSPIGITSQKDPGIRVKTAGFQPGMPPNYPANLPRPDFERLVTDLTPAGLSHQVPLLAMSLGIDVLPVEDKKLGATDFPAESPPLSGDVYYPVLLVGPHGWYAIEFSVHDSKVRSAELAPDIAAAEAAGEIDRSVFCYVLPTSTAALLPTEGESVRVLTPAAIGLAQGDEIRALNMHMGLYWTNLVQYPDRFTTRPLPVQVSVYFTLDLDLLPDDEPKTVEDDWQVPKVDAATIYYTTWTGEGWSPPDVYLHLSTLDVMLPEDWAIDGLALDTKCSPDTSDDELLYSLRGTPTAAPSVAEQVMHVTVERPRPRPIIVERPDGYGSLGRQMRGGQGIGDFCTADPWAFGGRQISVFQAERLVDDFFIARRLPPDGPYIALATLGEPSLMNASIEAPSAEHPWFGCDPVAATRNWGVEAFEQALLCVRGERLPRQVPEMRLAIAGYRHHDGKAPMMRACMSLPGANAAVDEVVVRWGCMVDYTRPTTQPGNIKWKGAQVLTNTGMPFYFDQRLPAEGTLRRRSRTTECIPEEPAPGHDTRNAFVMQWLLRSNGRTFISPISALRF